MKSSISVSRGPAGHFPESGLSRPMPRHSPRLPSEPPGLNLSLQASIAATRPQSEPPGLNLRLQASIWAWRLQSQLQASIWAWMLQSQPTALNLSIFPHVGPLPILIEIWHILFMTFAYIGPRPPGPFFPIWVPSKFVLKYSPTDLDCWLNWF